MRKLLILIVIVAAGLAIGYFLGSRQAPETVAPEVEEKPPAEAIERRDEPEQRLADEVMEPVEEQEEEALARRPKKTAAPTPPPAFVATPTPAPTPTIGAQFTDEQIREYHQRAQSDLRNCATGLESFFVDYGEYPVSLSQLTTPISYISLIPVDPFAEMPYIYRLTDTGWMLYSLGPDLEDQEGAVKYDIAKGLRTEGDIVRTGP